MQKGTSFPSVKGIVFRGQNPSQIILVQRGWDGQLFCEPAGRHINTNFTHAQSENFEEALTRELEELGIQEIIETYLGSYYFFWHNNQYHCGNCALFLFRYTTGPLKSSFYDVTDY